MVRSRPKSINKPAVADRSIDEIVFGIRNIAMESHALASALASEFCGAPAGVVPEWLEKLAAMNERSSGLTVEQIDELQRRIA